ncbi:MAG: hypothetical protein FWE91_09720 [Defluviitaleaceae bacterium]|nr:hypothetical protein [Defluviitaleaceae bacterium]
MVVHKQFDLSGGGQRPSRPFPNGTSYMNFNDAFCCRCNKYKLNEEGLPLPDNCTVENALSEAQFDIEKYPKDDIVEVGGYFHVCRHFESDDGEIMEQYKGLFEEGSGNA